MILVPTKTFRCPSCLAEHNFIELVSLNCADLSKNSSTKVEKIVNCICSKDFRAIVTFYNNSKTLATQVRTSLYI